MHPRGSSQWPEEARKQQRLRCLQHRSSSRRRKSRCSSARLRRGTQETWRSITPATTTISIVTLCTTTTRCCRPSGGRRFCTLTEMVEVLARVNGASPRTMHRRSRRWHHRHSRHRGGGGASSSNVTQPQEWRRRVATEVRSTERTKRLHPSSQRQQDTTRYGCQKRNTRHVQRSLQELVGWRLQKQ